MQKTSTNKSQYQATHEKLRRTYRVADEKHPGRPLTSDDTDSNREAVKISPRSQIA